KGLSIAGTAAMFLVGGGILAHGIPALRGWIEGLAMSLLFDVVVGIVAGALVWIGAGAVASLARRRGLTTPCPPGYCRGNPLREENRHAVLRKRPRPHPLLRSRLRLPPAADPGGRAQLGPLVLADGVALQPDGAVQGRLPLRLRRPAQRQPRPVERPPGDRPPLGRLHRRPAGTHGPPGHPGIPGHGLLHRRGDDPQPHQTGPRARRPGPEDAAGRVPA